MKKRTNFAAAILLASMMAVSTCAVTSMTAVADTTYTITMDTTTGHTYTAYQVFTGTLHEDTSTTPTTKTLSDITWGNGVNSSALVNALTSDSTYGTAFNTALAGKTTDAEKAAAVAAKLATYTNTSDVKALAKIIAANTTGSGTNSSGTTIGSLSAGYYLIKDTTASSSMPNGNTYSEFMLEVVSDVSVTAKDETVTSDKKVTDANDSTGTTEANKETADYDIGDDVPYVLTFTLPAKYAEYSKYPITFTDDMCAGLTYNGDAKIYYGESDTTGASITLSPVTGTEYTGTPAGQKYTYSITDLKADQASADTGSALKSLTAGSVIRIEYTAKLNGNAVVGNAGNPNKYNVTFANDPTWKPASETDTTPPPTGNTPPVTNTVFTYKLVVNKTDGTSALTGADFDLYKFVEQDTTGMTDEQKTAAGIISETIGGTATEGKWVVVTALNTGSVNPTKTKTASGTVENSVFTFSGIDDGVYKLVESTTPDGYNTIEPIIFTVTPADDGKLTNDESGSETVNLGGVSFTLSNSNGSLSGNVINNQGTILPSTGGIGTTIFYVVGGTLVAGAVVLLITKKRMNTPDQK